MGWAGEGGGGGGAPTDQAAPGSLGRARDEKKGCKPCPGVVRYNFTEEH